MAVDVDAAGTEVTEPADGNATQALLDSDPQARQRRNRHALPSGAPVRQAMVCGLVMIVLLAGLVGWLAYRADQSRLSDQERALFLQAGRQAALDLTTIDYTTADADIARVLDSATGKFHDDFQKRSQPLVDVVKQTQSKSVGTIAAAALESAENGLARVLVAVQVKTTSTVDANTHPVKGWRMRIDVQRVGQSMKVANVEFVP